MDYIYIGKILITILFSMILGLVSSIPVGAIQLEVIKKSINGHFKPALATAAGSATSDLLYGLLALFGFGEYLFARDFQMVIYSLGILVLSFLFWKTIRERHYMLHKEEQVVYKKRLSFLAGFTIAITNPGMIIWWVIGYKLFLDLQLFTTITPGIKLLFVFSAVLGLGGYLSLIAKILHRVKKNISEKFLYRTNIFLMSLLFILVVYFIVKLILLFLNYDKAPEDASKIFSQIFTNISVLIKC